MIINDDGNKKIGKKLFGARKSKGLSRAELGKLLGLHESTIKRYEDGDIKSLGIDKLQEFAKYLDVDPAYLMGWVVAEEPAPYNVGSIVSLPIVGRISCGNGALAYDYIEGYEPTPREWLNGGEYFYLRAKGDSMTGARIFDGDLLLIRKQSDVDDGDIAAVLIGEEAVLKKVYRSNGQLILQSENPNYPPLIAPPAEARIIGKLKKIVINM